MAATSECELIDKETVKEMLGGCSIKHLDRLADSGRMPGKIKIGALVRFRRTEISEWISRGCPRVRALAKGGAR